MNEYYGNNDWRDFLSLKHHGIEGQKWGEKNGPPYPLDYKSHSRDEKRLNSKSKLDNYDSPGRVKKRRVTVDGGSASRSQDMQNETEKDARLREQLRDYDQKYYDNHRSGNYKERERYGEMISDLREEYIANSRDKARAEKDFDRINDEIMGQRNKGVQSDPEQKNETEKDARLRKKMRAIKNFIQKYDHY